MTGRSTPWGPARPSIGLAALLLWLGGCGQDPGAPEPITFRVIGSEVRPNNDNVLSAIVVVRIDSGDSARVRIATGDGSFDAVTPAVVPTGDSVVLPVLGLLPETRYRLRPEVIKGSAVAQGPVGEFTTGTLPADLPRFVASGSSPSPGYVVFAAGRYGLAIDNTGRVVWYHRFPTGPGLNFMPQPTGYYYARPSTPDPGDVEPWVAIDVLGNVVATVSCAGGLAARFHDLVAGDDGYWLLCDETRRRDLSQVGGPAEALITGTAVQRLDLSGQLQFEWSPFDHLPFDFDPRSVSGVAVNWTHGNAIDLDRDGDVVVSFRNLSEITKIDSRTGAVRWRMGGRRNQFTFLGAGNPPWHRQHGVRMVDGAVLLLDNLGEASGSRVEQYRYEGATRTAWLEHALIPETPVIAELGGTTQRLPNGHTLAAYGNGGRVEEYDPTGRIVWRIHDPTGYIFRAERIGSLYRPGSPP